MIRKTRKLSRLYNVKPKKICLEQLANWNELRKRAISANKKIKHRDKMSGRACCFFSLKKLFFLKGKFHNFVTRIIPFSSR